MNTKMNYLITPDAVLRANQALIERRTTVVAPSAKVQPPAPRHYSEQEINAAYARVIERNKNRQ